MDREKFILKACDRSEEFSVSTIIAIVLAPIAGAFLAIAILAARAAFYLLSGVWLSSGCDAVRLAFSDTALVDLICDVDTSFIGLNEVTNYLTNTFDFSLLLFSVSILMMPIAFIVGFTWIRIYLLVCIAIAPAAAWVINFRRNTFGR